MLKGLVDIGSRNGLVGSIVEDLNQKIEEMEIEDVVMVLWCIGKIYRQGSKMQLVLKLFKRIS